METLETWWAGLCARHFDGAQRDSPAQSLYIIRLSMWDAEINSA